MKLIIGIPTGGDPTKPFLDSLRDMRLPHQITAVDRIVINGNFVPGQRELIVRRAFEEGADLLLMLDDDMVIPPDAIELLFATLEANEHSAIAGGLYYSRDGKRPMVVGNWHASDTTDATIPAFTSKSACTVDGIGFGCVLMRMAAFGKLQQPYFGTQIVIEPKQSFVRVCNEDYLLCERFRRAGFSVTLDGRVRCGHYDRGTRIVQPQTWEPDETTGVERMHVRQASGVEELVPFVPGGPHAPEEHLHAVLDYLFIS